MSSPVQQKFPPADLSPSEFERWLAQYLQAIDRSVSNFNVTHQEKIEVSHGTYDIDVTVRYQFLGMDYLMLIEAKRHTYPIKRDLVQILYQKLLDAGAQKAVLFATADFQSGAVEFAKEKGIALVYVSDGGPTFRSKGLGNRPTRPSGRLGKTWVLQGGSLDSNEHGRVFSRVEDLVAAVIGP